MSTLPTETTAEPRIPAGSSPHLMVGVPFFGETEFPQCLRAAAHVFHTWHYSFKIVSFLPAYDAHDRIYKCFVASGADVLLKLDADIVIRDDLGSVIRDFWTSGDKHWAIDIWDCYTRQLIPAIHIYSSRFNFTGYTDVNTDSFTEPVDKWVTGRFVADHGPALNAFEQFRTGMHRAWKRNGKSATFIQQYFARAEEIANQPLLIGQHVADSCPLRYDFGAQEIAQLFAEAIQRGSIC